MKKFMHVIYIAIFVTFLVSCQENKEYYEISVDLPDLLYVGETVQLKPTSEYVDDVFYFESSNVNVLVIDSGGRMAPLSAGISTVTITNMSKRSYIKEINVVEIPEVKGLRLEVTSELDNLFYVGKVYEVHQFFSPDKSYNHDVRYSYTGSFMDFDDKTGQVRFHKSGTYTLTAYLASDWNIQTSIKFNVVYHEDIEAYNLLFIGNSLTKYTYNIPNFIYEMLISDGVVVNFVLDSTTPQWIIDHEINFNYLINKDQYTHVFLQEYSNGPIQDYQKFEDAVIRFDDKIKTHGAQTILYQTWGYNYPDQTQRDAMTHELGRLYKQVSDLIDATLSPVGAAFLYVNQNYPNIALYQDLNHPSLYGALLSAYTHYVVLTKRSPLNNDWVYQGLDVEVMNILKEAAYYAVFNS